MIKKVLILGGSGMIGKSISRTFIKNNIDIINLDIKKTDINHNKYFQLIDSYQNILNYLEVIEEVDLIIHLISLSNPYEDKGFDQEFYNNFLPTINLLRTIKNFKKKIFFISSGGTIYGDSKKNKKISENNVINPKSNYGKYKYLLEQVFINNKGLNDLKIFRLGNAYGGFENILSKQGFISIAINKIYNNEDIILFNKGNMVRDFIHVSDISEILYKFCFVKSSEIIFNLSSGEGISILRVLQKISKKLKKTPKIIHKRDNSFIKYNVLDCAKIEKYVKLEDKIDIDLGLKLTLEEFFERF